MDPKRLVDFLLRAGLGVSFLYAAIAQLLYPEVWMAWFPSWLFTLIPQERVLLTAFSLYEIALTLWLFTDRKIFIAACLAAVTMLAIVLFNLPALDIVFRDIALLFTALALAVLHWDKQKNQQNRQHYPQLSRGR